jgi:hypothetical protein
VQTRTRNGIILLVLALGMAAGLAWMYGRRQQPELGSRSLDAVPAGALLVATIDLAAVRASPVGARLLEQGREIPGLGKVKDLCGFDPIEVLDEIAVAVPAAGDTGDFGLVGSGRIEGEALIACASKVIEGRGGQPVLSTIGSFQTVRDASLGASGGEIAVRDRGMLLLGSGLYLRAMIDAADKRIPNIRSSEAHGQLARQVEGSAVRVTVVLTPEQRRMLALELQAEGPASPGSRVAGGAAGAALGATLALHAVVACDEPDACRALEGSLRRARDERAKDYAIRIVGFGAVLDRLELEAKQSYLHARVELPAEEAVLLFERLVALRGLRHPMPGEGPERPAPEPAAPPSAPASVDRPRPDEVLEQPRPPSLGGTPNPRPSPSSRAPGRDGG